MLNSAVLLTFAAIAAAAGQLLFRVGARDKDLWIEFINAPVMAGLLLYGVGTLIWIYALSTEKLVNAYAFTGLTFVLVYVGAAFVLRETMQLGGIVGVLLVLAGIFLVMRYSS